MGFFNSLRVSLEIKHFYSLQVRRYEHLSKIFKHSQFLNKRCDVKTLQRVSNVSYPFFSETVLSMEHMAKAHSLEGTLARLLFYEFLKRAK